MDPTIAKKRVKRRRAPPPPNPFTGEVEQPPPLPILSDDEEEEVSIVRLVVCVCHLKEQMEFDWINKTTEFNNLWQSSSFIFKLSSPLLLQKLLLLCDYVIMSYYVMMWLSHLIIYRYKSKHYAEVWERVVSEILWLIIEDDFIFYHCLEYFS